MTVNQVRRNVDELRKALFKEDLAKDFNRIVINEFRGHIKVVTWAECLPYTDLRFATLDEFGWLLRKRQFSILLFDGSLLQISYKFKRGTLIEHRLCFYPFPLRLDVEELDNYLGAGFGFLDILEEAFSFGEFKERLSLQSPIRFDYDMERAAANHPASHMHLLRNECRVPVFAPLSVGHFIRFVFRRFYPEQWKEFDFIRGWPCQEFDRTVTVEQERQIYLNYVLE